MTQPVAPIAAPEPALPPEAGARATEAGPRATEAEPGPPAGDGTAAAIDDRLVRAVGIPGFGLSIPHLSGLLSGVAVASADFWLGTAWFLVLAAAIWHGNRRLLFAQRRHF